LRCLAVRGVITIEQAATLSGLSYDATYQALNKLSRQQGGVSPALNVASAALEGERGKPRKVFFLDEVGGALLHEIDGEVDLCIPKLEEHTEIAAAVMAMDVYVAAYQAKLEAKVEKVVPFGSDGSFIRVDDFVTLPNGKPALFECEQTAAAWSKARIQDKLRRLLRFYQSDASRQVERAIRVIFNIHLQDTQTLAIWQEQLALLKEEYGKPLPFDLYWSRIGDFLKKPEWSELTGFQPLEAASPPTDKAPAAVAPASSQTVEMVKSLPEPVQGSLSSLNELDLVLNLLYQDQQAEFQRFQAAQNPRQRSHRFFALILFIYKASHYRHSPTLDYATLPVESLYLLRRYLHAHQNAALLSKIKQGLAIAAKNADGVTRYRNAMTQFIWNVFLRWHGFARGGPLRVKVEPPGFETGRSDFYVEVHVSNPDMFDHPYVFRSGTYEMEPEEQALAWVLEAMVNYPTELGLE
jgi:hypothetical protein